MRRTLRFPVVMVALLAACAAGDVITTIEGATFAPALGVNLSTSFARS